MESSRPEYTAELLRHFADLRDGTHGDARSRRDKERLFTAAVALLDPHARRALKEINTDLLLGTGEVTATGVRCRSDGLDAIWALSWPQQQAAAPPAPPAPPVNRPPPGQLPCNWSGDSGGEGVTRNKHFLGDKPGFVAINYNLYVKPDDIKVIYRGQVLAGTGGPRSGRGGFGFDWKPVAGDYSVDVVVTGEMWGTRWTYAMVCPR